MTQNHNTTGPNVDKLMTKKLEARFRQVGSQNDTLNPIVVAKYFNATPVPRFFHPSGRKWYAVEYDPENQTFRGYSNVLGGCIFDPIFFSLEDLQASKAERDLHFEEMSIGECMKEPLSYTTGSKRHRLMTKKLEARFKQVGSQYGSKDPLVLAKFVHPTGLATWYATEYDPKTNCIFCYVSFLGDYDDGWSYADLGELGSIGIQRDSYFTEKPIKECLKKAKT